MLRRLSRQTVVAFALLVGLAHPAATVTLTENFDDGVLDPSLVLAENPGFSASLTGGQLVVEKAEGTGNGNVRLSTVFQVTGDFEVTVWADRIDLSGPAAMGSAVGDGLGGFADPYFNGSEQIIGNLFFPSPPGFGQQVVFDSSSPAIFRVHRSGMTMTLEYDVGGGFQVLRSATDPILTNPMRVSVFLLQEAGSTAAHVGRFDDLVITADAFVFPTTTTTSTTTTTTTSISTTTSTEVVTTTSTSVTTTVPPPDARLLPGKKLLVKEKKSGVQRLQLLLKDSSIAAAQPCEVAGELVIEPSGGAAFRLVLEAELWKPINAAKPERGCKYRKGPLVATVQIKPGKALAIAAEADDLGVPLGTDPRPLRLELRHGDARHCLEFGGRGEFKAGKKLLAKDAARATACPGR